MTQSESSHLGLVAVTACGVRFYFGSAMGVSGNHRPTTLALQHIRLPPGFTASHAAIGRPSKVHISYYNNGMYVIFSIHLNIILHPNEWYVFEKHFI